MIILLISKIFSTQGGKQLLKFSCSNMLVSTCLNNEGSILNIKKYINSYFTIKSAST